MAGQPKRRARREALAAKQELAHAGAHIRAREVADAPTDEELIRLARNFLKEVLENPGDPSGVMAARTVLESTRSLAPVPQKSLGTMPAQELEQLVANEERMAAELAAEEKRKASEPPPGETVQ